VNAFYHFRAAKIRGARARPGSGNTKNSFELSPIYTAHFGKHWRASDNASEYGGG